MPLIGSREHFRNLTESEQKTSNLQLLLEQKLRGKKGTLNPNMYLGASATINMSDKIPNGFYTNIAQKQPDGYLVGVGIGGLITFIKTFTQKSALKGIISVDANPQVILTAKLFIENLKESKTKEEFISMFFEMTDENYKKKLLSLAGKDKDCQLKNNFRREVKRFKQTQTSDPFLSRPSSTWYFAGKDWQRPSDISSYALLVVDTILDNFQILRKLSVEGKIASVYANFVDPVVIHAITELPGFQISRNIIYLSNIIDYLTELGVKPSRLEDIANLKAYESSTKTPIFIDSLLSQNLILRIGNTVPDYKEEDFI